MSLNTKTPFTLNHCGSPISHICGKIRVKRRRLVYVRKDSDYVRTAWIFVERTTDHERQGGWEDKGGKFNMGDWVYLNLNTKSATIGSISR